MKKIAAQIVEPTGVSSVSNDAVESFVYLCAQLMNPCPRLAHTAIENSFIDSGAVGINPCEVKGSIVAATIPENVVVINIKDAVPTCTQTFVKI